MSVAGFGLMEEISRRVRCFRRAFAAYYRYFYKTHFVVYTCLCAQGINAFKLEVKQQGDSVPYMQLVNIPERHVLFKCVRDPPLMYSKLRSKTTPPPQIPCPWVRIPLFSEEYFLFLIGASACFSNLIPSST